MPEAFRNDGKQPPASREFALSVLKDFLLDAAIVRDLCNGEWTKKMFELGDLPTRKLLEALKGRLHRFPTALPKLDHETDAEWYWEAQASHEKSPLDAILVADPQSADWTGDKKILDLMSLPASRLWQQRNSSIRLRRQTDDYLKLLTPVFKRANYITFIDPHLDEREREAHARSTYREFSVLVQRIPTRSDGVAVRLEIHICKGGDASRSDWEARVGKSARALLKAGQTADVFVWPLKFHDRYLITDLLALNLPNGFDTAKDEHEKTTWARLTRHDAEDIEKDFEANGACFGVPCVFQIGAVKQ